MSVRFHPESLFDLFYDFFFSASQKWVSPKEHLVKNGTSTVNIHFVCVVLALKDFWSHVQWSSFIAVEHLAIIVFFCKTEISYFKGLPFNEYISRFKISMNHSCCAENLKSFDNLPEVGQGLFLSNFTSFFKEFLKIPFRTIFHEEIQVAFGLHDVDQFDHVFMGALAKATDLLLELNFGIQIKKQVLSRREREMTFAARGLRNWSCAKKTYENDPFPSSCWQTVQVPIFLITFPSISINYNNRLFIFQLGSSQITLNKNSSFGTPRINIFQKHVPLCFFELKYSDSLQQMNYTQLDLKSQLVKEPIGDTILYYSLVKKEGKTISFLTNERLLIYDDKRRLLFYINDFKNIPFKDKVPNPKNESMPVNLCTFSNPATTNNMQIRYTGKNSKGELETTEWNFEYDTKKLLNEWMKLLQNQKNRLVERETGEKGAGFIHDALMEAVQVKKQEKETILKPEEQVVKNMLYPQETASELKNSRLSDSKRITNIKPSNSAIVGASQSNIRETSKDPKLLDIGYEGTYSGIKPNASDIRNSNNLGISRGDKPIPYASDIRNTQNLSVSRGGKPIDVSGIRNSEIKNSQLKPPAGSNVYLPQDSRSRQEKQTESSIDWNHRFIKQPTEATLHEFEEEAVKALMAIWTKDYNSLRDPRRVYESHGLIIATANCFTKEATLLKRQFRNYHFILEACKNKLVVGVPLCSLIEWEGVIALAKAPLPQQAEQVRLNKIALEVRELQRYTRVSNSTLQKGTLWDLTSLYGLNGQRRLIYIDGLTQYLPIHIEEEMNGSSLRPQYLLDSVNQVISGGDVRGGSKSEQKQLATACEGLSGCMKELANYLNSQQTLWVDALELKEIFHNFGVNFKLLPRVYDAVGSKHVKKYLQSVMTAKVAKDHLYDILLQNRKEENRVKTQRVVEDYIKLLMEGNNSNSSQIWKQLSIKFKKQFSAPISNTELIPGFFLNSLLKFLRVRVDISKFAKGKKIFKEQGIVNDGFVVAVDPKIKSYYRFSTEFVEKVKYACREQKKDHEIYDQIIAQLQLKSRPLPKQYTMNNNYQAVLQYLAYYTPPPSLDPNSELKNVPIYESFLKEPPSAFSLRITKSYLEWAIKREKNEQFKKGVEESLKLSEFWLEDGHVFQTDLLQLLSDFYSSQGNYEESINFMKEALSKIIRTCGTQSRGAGNKYYELGDRELKAGRKKEALQNFYKAKANMQVNKNQSIKYPLLMMRISSLHLNSGDIEGCIEEALDSIKQFEQYDRKSGNPSLTEGYKVKTFEVLARAYEISSRRGELKDMALICAKKFNGAKMQWTYQQMVRICLAAAIFNHTPERCQFFLSLCSKLQKEEEPLDPSTALKDLMTLSQSFIVMDKFLTRFDSLQRIAGEGASRKPMSQDSRDFLLICKRLTVVVGEDYIQGLVQQKQYE